MNNTAIRNLTDSKISGYYTGGLVVLSVGCVLSLILEEYILFLILLLIPFLIYFTIRFQDYYVEIFIASLFFARTLYWPLRVQSSLVAAVILIFFLLTSRKFGIFNELKLPGKIKIIATFLIFSVIISGTMTLFSSTLSVYFSLLFIIFLSLSYVIFRSVKSFEEIDRYLNFFPVVCGISGLVIIAQIIVTGKLRSLGLTSYAVMDFSAMALLTVVFRNFLLSKINRNSMFLAAVIFVILITTQSRFAWLGFLITLIYGLIISFIFSEDTRAIIKKRMPILLIASAIGIALVFIIGLKGIFLSRLDVTNFTLFEGSSGQLTSNSLETRVFIWVTAYNTFIHHPFIGVGYLMFSEISEVYNLLPDFLFIVYVYGLDAHTTYLNFLVETGIVGLTAFVSYVVIIFLMTLKSIKESKSLVNLKVSIILNMLVFFIMVHSVYSGAFTMGQNALHMHFIFGLAIANYVLTNEQSRKDA